MTSIFRKEFLLPIDYFGGKIMAFYKREEGREQPYWKLGIFKIRLPFIHHRLEWVELFQGLVLFAIGLSVIPIMEESLGLTYGAALASVIIFQFLMMIPSMLGVPMVAGQLTPMIPIVIVFLANFEPGSEAVQAMIALQLSIAIIFFIMGVTGLGNLLIKILPSSIRGGIILGAGLTAIIGQIEEGGALHSTPIALIIGGFACLYIMYSNVFLNIANKSKIAKNISNFGIVPAMVLAIIVGVIVKEYPLPQIEWGLVVPAFGELWQFTPFVVGFPSMEIWLATIPTAIIAYIIGYGDIVVGNELLERADKKRKDEKIHFDIGLLHYTVFIRNGILSLFSPHPGMAGPIFTAGMATVSERYANGENAMESIYSGSTSFGIGVFVPLFFMPLVTLFQPFLPIALSITLLLTGFLCISVGLSQLTNDIERGIGGIIAVVLAIYGAALALVIGILLYFFIQFQPFQKKKGSEKRIEKVENL